MIQYTGMGVNIYTCTIDRRESSPSNEEALTGTPITGMGVNAATIPKKQVTVYSMALRSLMH